jgi:hypothetical protein
MEKELETLGKFVRSKQMIISFILMAIVSILLHPILSLKQGKALELQERIKKANINRLKSFGGTSLERMQ